MRAALARLIDRIDNAAALPGDPAPVRLRKTLLVFLGVFLVLGGACAAAAFRGVGAAGAVAAACALVSAAGLAALLVFKREEPIAWLQLACLLVAPLSLQWTGGGWSATGGAVLWSLLAPAAALVLVSDLAATLWFAAFLLALLAAGAGELLRAGGGPSAVRRATLLVENAAVLSSILFITLRYFIREREKAHRALALEQEKSERLLLNILPAPIAERLKASGGTIADGFSDATVLFSDIVGFTPLSATLTPARLVEVLNALFSEFDRLAEVNRVEKIKTIGDAYMVCAGLPEPAADHAERVAEMALGMREALERFNAERGLTLRIRIGVNSGPVVGGVIGLKKFIYDLWGDTVNTASRMESHGVPGQIQVTEATRALLSKKYAFEARGPIEVKGIGKMPVFLLTGRL